MTELYDKLEETLEAVGRSPQYLDDPIVMDEYARACWTMYEMGDSEGFFFYIGRYQTMRVERYISELTIRTNHEELDEEGGE